VKKTAGFSLIEILVAFAIAAISLTLLTQIFASATRNVANARDFSEAIDLAESVLDEATVPGTELVSEGDSGKFTWGVEAAPYELPEEIIEDSIAKTTTAPFELENVSVEVRWHSGARHHKVELQRLVLRPPP
jgi:general secretion pathway protein I